MPLTIFQRFLYFLFAAGITFFTVLILHFIVTVLLMLARVLFM